MRTRRKGRWLPKQPRLARECAKAHSFSFAGFLIFLSASQSPIAAKMKMEETMSKELAKTYDPHGIEDRLYQKWLDKKYFHAEVDESKKPFTIVIPPPNITGQLHMGHALDNTMQDILIRFKRMQGYNALWQPGTDHASIATEVKIIETLKKKASISATLAEKDFKARLGMERGIRWENHQSVKETGAPPVTGTDLFHDGRRQ